MKWLPVGVLLFCFPVLTGFSAENHVDLPEAERAQLEKDKLLISGERVMQTFEPYIRNEIPVFITSDAVLNAFHVLFEESMTRTEAAKVPSLVALLDKVVGGLPKALEEVKAVPAFGQGAARRAEIMLKTALRLLGREAPGSSTEVEKIIAEQVRAVEAATGIMKPEWLGPPDPGFTAIDFTRYKPRGFYVGNPELERYFRAVSWLQSVPFRIQKEEEFLAARLIGRAGHLAYLPDSAVFGWNPFFLFTYYEFLGAGDEADLGDLIAKCKSDQRLVFADENSIGEQMKEEMEEQIKRLRSQVNGTVRDDADLAPADPFHVDPERELTPEQKEASANASYRLLSAVALPDAVMFQRTSVPDGPSSFRYPATLEVAAGLGSGFASKVLAGSLPEPVWSKMSPALSGLGSRKTGLYVYDDYLEILKEIVNEPEVGAPAFMLGDPWQRKSCQTLLSSWVLMRHSLILQAKTLQYYGSATGVPPGFVEPDPEVFRRLGELSLRCMAFFSESGAFDENSAVVILNDLRRGIASVDIFLKEDFSGYIGAGSDLDRAIERVRDMKRMPEQPRREERASNMAKADQQKAEELFEQRFDEYLRKFGEALKEVVHHYESATPAKRAEMLAEMRQSQGSGMMFRWKGLITICLQAQSIAHRQLRRVPLNRQEADFIKSFGIMMAQAMFYDGNSYVNPRDDAPRVVDVFSGPQGHLHAGCGFPRVLYVLYPWEGKELLLSVQCSPIMSSTMGRTG